MGDRDWYLTGRHAVVTGASRGIGAAIAGELARLGAGLTLMGRNRSALESRSRALGETHRVKTSVATCDVSDELQVESAFRLAREALGPVHVLVNNASLASSSPFLETRREDWDRLLAVNVTGTYLCMRQVLGAMLGAKSGRIVNIASTAGLRGGRRLAAYCTSKHAVIGLTRAVAAETARHGVTVNAVCPGYTDTDMATTAVENLVRSGRTEEEARKMIAGTNPGGRLITPEEVAHTVGWLCSPEASAVNGQAIVVAGGEVG